MHELTSRQAQIQTCAAKSKNYKLKKDKYWILLAYKNAKINNISGTIKLPNAYIGF